MLPDLLRDLGDPFPALWNHLHGAHGPLEAARHFAKVLGQLETPGGRGGRARAAGSAHSPLGYERGGG